ncbi:MAG: hypothetical protein R2856_22160 [Caldilineaceae bacterium]
MEEALRSLDFLVVQDIFSASRRSCPHQCAFLAGGSAGEGRHLH